MKTLSELGRVKGKKVTLDCYKSDDGSFWFYVSGSKFYETRWMVVPADELLGVLTTGERDGKV